MTVTTPEKPPAQRRRRPPAPKVAQGDLDRVAAFLKAAGAKVAAVDLTPGRARIITTDGQGLTLDADEDELDRELAAHRQARAHGPS